MASNLTVRVVTDSEEFRSLRQTWDRLLAKSSDNDVYLTWEWLFTWWKHYGKGNGLNILLIEDEGRIIGIVPLMRVNYGKFPVRLNVLENISSMDPDYGGVILTGRKEDCVATLLSYLEGIINGSSVTLRLSRIAEDSEFLALMRKQYSSFSNSLSLYDRTLTTCPYIPLPATWDDYLASFSRKTRNTLRRKLKSLRKEHDVEFESCGRGEDVKGNVHVFYQLHQRGWHSRGLSGALVDARTREFNVDLAQAFSEKGWLNLSFLAVDGEPASAVYGFEYGRKFYYGLTGFNPEYSKHSIGHLHVMFLIEQAIQNGLREFDFLIGAEEYKYRWHALDRANVQIIMMKRGFLGRLRLKLLDLVLLFSKLGKHGLRESFRLYLRKRRQEQGRQDEI
jgi:CelD/BcsL family acetyltransferase involved in cellulose biosynthesis